jgi:hypothetical protein
MRKLRPLILQPEVIGYRGDALPLPCKNCGAEVCRHDEGVAIRLQANSGPMTGYVIAPNGD